MGPHDEFVELCAVSTSGELTGEERRKLEKHLTSCSSCRALLKQYQSVTKLAIPAIGSELPHEDIQPHFSWSDESAEAALFERIAEDEKHRGPNRPEALPHGNGRLRGYVPSSIRWTELWVSYAAGILIALALGIAAYRMGAKHGVEEASLVQPAIQNPVVAAERDLSDAGHERRELVAQMAERDKQISELKQELAQQAAAFHQQGSQGTDESKVGSDSATLESRVEELQKKLDNEEQQRAEEAARALALQAKADELSRELQGRDATITQGQQTVRERDQLLDEREGTIDKQQSQIGEQRELLDHDRDIRELMGARDLYIAEVYDVARTGQTTKPYGRLFYTKGKSLIFYAYDLDQEAGFKNASTFQAWGRRGPEKEQALNLGVFYEDNASKKRWVLKFDDPKTLAQIDAVFVTVEPGSGSPRPSGKPLLFAYLRVNPNHP